jgi:hypothetical protein
MYTLLLYSLIWPLDADSGITVAHEGVGYTVEKVKNFLLYMSMEFSPRHKLSK